MNHETLLENLCDLFDDELERQETVLAVTIAQGRAARDRDRERLEAKTATLHLLLQQAVDAEQERIKLVRQIVDHYHISEARQTLSALIEVAPAPWKTRMSEFQRRVRDILQKTRITVQQNDRVMRRSLKIVDRALNIVFKKVPAPNGAYDAHGPERPAAQLGIIDQKG